MLIDKRGYEAQYLPVRPALFFIALVIAAFSAFLAGPPLLHAGTDGPEAGVKIVEASGFASVIGRDAAMARDGAVDDALRKAVEQAVGTMVSAETMVENYQVLKDSVFTK